jgi:hypothetical protein
MHFSTPRKQTSKSKYKKELLRFDPQQFVDLCKIQCTLTEIAHFFHITNEQLNEECKKSFGVPSDIAQKEFNSEGKISLRRSQFKNAVEKNNPILQIWLGKNYLNQCEDPAKRVQDEQKNEMLKDIIQAVKEV